MASARLGGRGHRAAAGIVMLVGLIAVAGCGKPPYTYVSNSDARTYFKVPSGWSEADVEAIDDFFAYALFRVEPGSAAAIHAEELMWSTGYDASDAPTGLHMVTSIPTSDPIVYSMVVGLPPSVQGAVSLDYLRNIFLPVTTSARAASQEAGMAMPGFELLHDGVLTPEEGIHGVRVVYNYRFAGNIVHTIDLTAHTSNDSGTIYVLLIRCSASCYQEREAELNEVATSFTVRSRA